MAVGAELRTSAELAQMGLVATEPAALGLVHRTGRAGICFRPAAWLSCRELLVAQVFVIWRDWLEDLLHCSGLSDLACGKH